MKKTTIILLALAIGSCKPAPKKEEVKEEMVSETTKTEKTFPQDLVQVFEAHGGLATWKNQRTLAYELPKKDFTETHTVDLWSRNDRVDAPEFSMGSEGEKVWLLDADKLYKGDAGFYHNLMFYFYAMPFVLADDGIIYSETDDLVFEGKNYPGIRIAYESGVGTSSKDEYFLHFDSDTHQMVWLGYTVTYRTGEKSETVKWIRYDDWQTVEGLLLPKSITWYNFEGNQILDARNNVPFEQVTLSKTVKPEGFYTKPENATYVEVKKN